MDPVQVSREADARARFYNDALTGWKMTQFSSVHLRGTEKATLTHAGPVRGFFGIYTELGSWRVIHLPSGLQVGPDQREVDWAKILAHRLTLTPVAWSILKRDSITQQDRMIAEQVYRDHMLNTVPEFYLAAVP